MSRLPIVGEENWGDILNDYLLVSHKSDGTINDNYIPKGKLESSVQSTLDAVAAKYAKPATGIPASDMSPAAQSSLAAADASTTGPTATTDNAVARWDGTDGSTIQNSPTTISDTGTLSVTTDTGLNSISLFSGANPTLAIKNSATNTVTSQWAATATNGATIFDYAGDLGGNFQIRKKVNSSISTDIVFSLSSAGVGIFKYGANANNQKIISLADPTNAQDAATKNYVDTKVASSITTAMAAIDGGTP